MRSIKWLLLGISVMLFDLCMMHNPNANFGAVDNLFVYIGFLISLIGFFITEKKLPYTCGTIGSECAISSRNSHEYMCSGTEQL